MLLVNFVNEKTQEARNAFYAACQCKCNMLKLADVKHQKARKHLELGKLEEKGEDTAKAELELAELKEKSETLKEIVDSQTPIYEKVVSDMVGAGCKKEAVENILALIACDGNFKLFPSANIFSNADLVSLITALDALHCGAVATDDGLIAVSDNEKTACKSAKAAIVKLVKDNFSLVADTPYTSRAYVKLTGRELKMLHESFVTGLRGKKSDGDDYSYTVSYNKAARITTDSKGNQKIVANRLLKTISMLVFERLQETAKAE